MIVKVKKRYQNMSSAVKTSIWFTFCNFLQRGAAFITVPIFTRLLTKEEYGICNIYFAWFEIFILFTSLKIPYEGLNNGLIRYEKDKDRYVSSVMGLIITMTLTWGGICVIFHSWIEKITGLDSFILGLMFIQLLFNPSMMLWTNRKRFDFKYRWPVLVTLLSTILNPLIAIVVIIATEYRTEARIISSVFVQGFFGFFLCIVLFYHGKCFYKKEYWKFALTFNLPLVFYYLSQSVLNQSDRIMINLLEGSGKAAIYSVAYSAGTIMLLLVSAVNGSFNPWMYKKLKAKQYSDINNIVIMLCALMLGATLFMSILAPDVVKIMATEEYNQAIWIIPPVSASVFFVFVYMMFANVEMYCDRNKGIFGISAFCSLANLLLNAIFIPLFGYMAAGWTTLVCYMLLSVLHYLLMKQACKENKIQEKIFPEKLIVLVSICVFVLSIFMLGVYKIKGLRYGLLVLEVIAFWKSRHKLLGTWKTSGE